MISWEKKIDHLMERYDFKTRPFKHQAKEFYRHRKDYARAQLWSMRTGKSKSIIDLACYSYQQEKIDGVLVIAPNGVHENWIVSQLPDHHWDTVPYRAMTWRMRDLMGKKYATGWYGRFERNLKSDKLFWLAVNSESMIQPRTRALIRKFMKHRKFLIVFDESDDFKTPGSKRTKMARAIKRRAVMRRITTGTATLESPLDAYTQYELLEEKALGFDTFGEFEKHYAVYEMEKTKGGREYPVLAEYKNMEDLRDRIAQWSTVVLREDCDDLPDLMVSERFIKPTTEQVKIYKQLHKEFVVAIKNQEVSIGENTQRLIKLQQVLSGWLKDEFGDIHDIPGKNPRLEALCDELMMNAGQAIVWCQFKYDIKLVVKRLKKEGYKVCEYHGGCGPSEKLEARTGFQKGKYDVLVGQPDAGGRGLDLSAASLIVNYSHTPKARTRAQSEERGSKVGKKKVLIVDLLMPDSPDTHFRELVKNKRDISSELTGVGLKTLLERIRL